jgi:hypothetical protein
MLNSATALTQRHQRRLPHAEHVLHRAESADGSGSELYNKQRLHKAGYFRELLATNPDIDEGFCELLRVFRETVVRLQKTESRETSCAVCV